MSVTRVLVGDRSIAVRAVLRKALEASAEISVVGEADDGREMVRLAARHHPDVVVLDLDLHSLAGRELVDAMGARRRVPLFVITPKQHRDGVREAIGAQGVGVVAVFSKPERPDEWTQLGKTLREAVAPLAADAAEGGGVLGVGAVGKVQAKDVRARGDELADARGRVAGRAEGGDDLRAHGSHGECPCPS